MLLRKKAAEELKKEQERKAAERRRIIEERCGKPKLIDEANEGNADFGCDHQFLYTANKLPMRLVGVFHHFSFHLTIHNLFYWITQNSLNLSPRVTMKELTNWKTPSMIWNF